MHGHGTDRKLGGGGGGGGGHVPPVPTPMVVIHRILPSFMDNDVNKTKFWSHTDLCV